MERQELEQTATALIAKGKAILAADETVPTLTKRFATLKIESTEDSRRTYREMFFTTPDVAAFISGVTYFGEAHRQDPGQMVSRVRPVKSDSVLHEILAVKCFTG